MTAGWGPISARERKEGSRWQPTYCSAPSHLRDVRPYTRIPSAWRRSTRRSPSSAAGVLQQYALLGTYDFLTVVEAPDNETVAHLSVDLGSRGTVGISTFPALDVQDFVKKLKGPKQLGHN